MDLDDLNVYYLTKNKKDIDKAYKIAKEIPVVLFNRANLISSLVLQLDGDYDLIISLDYLCERFAREEYDKYLSEMEEYEMLTEDSYDDIINFELDVLKTMLVPYSSCVEITDDSFEIALTVDYQTEEGFKIVKFDFWKNIFDY